ncbi:hypothetical protein ACN6MY_05910 [Peribacillus sp. B-H-3]|uniref:hypothetical protein n=1 Tax=Peribacillus sp. B-H-3 TaxID=3400420 RepID=UPI003B0278BB
MKKLTIILLQRNKSRLANVMLPPATNLGNLLIILIKITVLTKKAKIGGADPVLYRLHTSQLTAKEKFKLPESSPAPPYP